MDFMDDLGKVITETAESVAKKTGEVVEVQRLKSQIYTLERGIDRGLIDLGKMVYNEFSANGNLDEKYKDICREIAEKEEDIQTFHREIAEIKGKCVCPVCKSTMDKEAIYCMKCGELMKQETPESEVTEETADEEAVTTEDQSSED